MREIKFRAWDNDMHKWTTAFDMDNDGVIYPGQTPYSNNPDIHIMQYTGLKDKNGREVYEGDLYTMPPFDKDSKQYEVKWEYSGFHLPNSEAMEVVGNIWES